MLNSIYWEKKFRWALDDKVDLHNRIVRLESAIQNADPIELGKIKQELDVRGEVESSIIRDQYIDKAMYDDGVFDDQFKEGDYE